jgi:ribosomal protein L40E
MICDNCKTDIPENAKFCRTCGTAVVSGAEAVPETRKCPGCGADNPVSAKFCRVDGQRLVDQAEKPEEHSVAAQGIQVGGMLCPGCGDVYPPGSKFCKIDGSPLQVNPSAETGGNQGAELTGEKVLPETEAPRESIAPRGEDEREPAEAKKHGELHAGGLNAEAPTREAPTVSVPPIPVVENPASPPGDATPVHETNIPQRKPSPVVAWMAMFSLASCISIGGAYYYFAKVRGNNRPAEVTAQGPREAMNPAPVQAPAATETAPALQPPLESVDATNAAIKQPETSAGKNNRKTGTVTQKPPVIDNTSKPVVDPAIITGDIIRSLKSNGLNRIRVEVVDGQVVVLTGAVHSRGEKNRAFEIAREIGSGMRIKDRVFIVE